MSSTMLALVTGASSGIGQATALRLSKEGYFTLVHYNKNHSAAEQTLELIKEKGGDGALICFDVKDSATIENQLDDFFREFPQLTWEVLVNNAGLHLDGMAGMMSDNDFDQVVRTNMYGPFYLMRYAVKKMLRQRRGCIVNMSSLSGQVGNPGQINYAASKAGLIAMTKSLSQELGRRGIRVNSVSPGLIETEMVDGIPHIEEIKKRIPLQRLGLKEEVAGCVAFLCSKDASYITGHTLSVNGGLFPS